jgi:hypothetical protein
LESQSFTPITAAIRLTHWLDAAEAAGLQRFPVDVKDLALQVGQQLKWSDPIFTVEPANIDSFEGGLFRVDGRGWALLYNERMGSPGRIRFTQAHELGHYLLHRALQLEFRCSQADMLHVGQEQHSQEADADGFASLLLMPMKQFRACTTGQPIDFDVLSDASSRFGVSLTAVALRWIQSTTESAVLVLSRDGFMEWSVSSERARKNGAFFRTRGRVVELPADSLAADDDASTFRGGESIRLHAWFPHAHRDAVAREMRLNCENYGCTLSLLHLSAGDSVWEPRAGPED